MQENEFLNLVKVVGRERALLAALAETNRERRKQITAGKSLLLSIQKKEENRSKNERLFDTAVDAMETRYSRPLIRDTVHAGEGAYGCTLAYASWPALARKMAAWLPGIVMPTRHGVVWINGANGPHGTLIDNRPIDPALPEKGTRLDNIIEARTCVSRTEYNGPIPWTMGGIGKRLLKWAVKPDIYRPSSEELFTGINQGYHRCIPGQYTQGANLFDVSAYYWNIFSRFDNPELSLRVLIGKTSITFDKWNDGERERFSDVMGAVKYCKNLRNAMVGAAQGTMTKGFAYTSLNCDQGKARLVPIPGRAGAFRNAALLAVRTGWELCQKEALTNNAIYAIVDCVMLPEGKPTVWPSFGFPCHLIQSGISEVYARGNYRIGFEAKQLYKWGDRTEKHEPGDIVLPVQYHEKWL